MQPIYVVKAGGEKELFSEEKVRKSIRRAGIPRGREEEILAHVKEVLKPEMSTRVIFGHIVEFLSKGRPAESARYGLKQSIMQLGPSGYTFEKYVAAVLAGHGYSAETNLILPGKCISHEIDVLAQMEGKRYMIECKFHNLPGSRTDAKVALYVKSRFLDLKVTHHLDQAWVVTNTKCTVDALAFATCEGIKIISWGYPEKGNLQDLVESLGLYPITCQTLLSKKQVTGFLQRGVVLCKDLVGLPDERFAELGISTKTTKRLRDEVNSILH